MQRSFFKLTIHPTKTALIRFRRPASSKETDNENGSFDFLGFTHFWAKTRQGYWVIKRKTAKKRLRRATKSLWQWCREHRHDNLMEQYKALCLKLQGHYQHYGIRSNFKMLEVVFEHAERRHGAIGFPEGAGTASSRGMSLRGSGKSFHYPNPGYAMPYEGSKVMPEEPYALIGHVRVCGGVRLGNRRIYPEADPEE